MGKMCPVIQGQVASNGWQMTILRFVLYGSFPGE
jgi:hypothetical protein